MAALSRDDLINMYGQGQTGAKAGSLSAADLVNMAQQEEPEDALPLQPGASDKDVAAAFGYDPVILERSTIGKNFPNILSAMVSGQLYDPEQQPTRAGLESSAPGRVIHGVQQGILALTQLAGRAGQLAGVLSPDDVQVLDLFNKVREYQFQHITREGEGIDPETGETKFDPLSFVGGMALPMKAVPLKKGESAAKRTAKLAGTGAAGAALYEPVVADPQADPAEDQAAFWKQKAVQGGVGAVAGPIGAKVVELGMAPIGKAVGGLQKKFKPEYDADIALHEKHGVRLDVAALTDNKLLLELEKFGTGVPGSMRAHFRARVKEAGKAGDRMRGRLYQQMLDTDWGDLSDVMAAAASGRKSAQRLINELRDADDDWHRILQLSGKLKGYKSQLQADKLYEEAFDELDQLGNINVSNTLGTLDETIADLSDSILEDAPATVKFFQHVRNKLTNEEVISKSGLLDADGKPIELTVIKPANTLTSTLHDFRRQLGEKINELQSSNPPRTVAAARLRNVLEALDQDIDAAANQSGGPGLSKWNRARDYFKNEVVPFRDNMLAKALRAEDYDEVYGKFIQRGKGVRAQRFYNALGDKGRAAVRYGMMNEALVSAMKDGELVPQNIARYFNKVEAATDINFTGREADEVNGFIKLMNTVEPNQTSQWGVAWTAGGVLLGDVRSIGLTQGVGLMLRGFFGTERGRNFLLAANRLSTDDPQFGKMVGDITQFMAASTGAGVEQYREEIK